MVVLITITDNDNHDDKDNMCIQYNFQTVAQRQSL